MDEVGRRKTSHYRDLNFDPSVVQPVASRYTDCAIPALSHDIIQHEINRSNQYDLDGQGSIPNKGTRIFLLHRVQTGFGVHPTSYPMETGNSFSGDKAAGV
jgi:hypothetical protein